MGGGRGWGRQCSFTRGQSKTALEVGVWAKCEWDNPYTLTESPEKDKSGHNHQVDCPR